MERKALLFTKELNEDCSIKHQPSERTIKDICGTLEYILLKSNVLLEAKKDGFRPITVDFEKRSPIEKEKGYKRSYGAEYIAPELKKGHKQSSAIRLERC